MKTYILNFSLCIAILTAGIANAQEEKGTSAEELAKQLANPVAALISVPLQSNFDLGVGTFNSRHCQWPKINFIG